MEKSKMEKIKIGELSEKYDIVSIQPVGIGILQIEFADKIPTTWDGDLTLYTAGDVEATVLSGYDTLLSQDGKTVQIKQTGCAVEDRRLY